MSASSRARPKPSRIARRARSGRIWRASSGRWTRRVAELSWRAERSQKRELGLLITEVEAIDANIAGLRAKLARHGQLKQELDDLYQRAFAGDTPAFPQEDEAEDHLRSTKRDFEGLQAELNRESGAQAALMRAQQALRMCVKSVSEALQASQMDLFSRSSFAGAYAPGDCADHR